MTLRVCLLVAAVGLVGCAQHQRSVSQPEPAFIAPPAPRAAVQDLIVLPMPAPKPPADSSRVDYERQIATALIADAQSLTPVPLAAAPVAMDSGDPLPTLTLDQYANHDRVEYYVRLFTRDARSNITARLNAGTRYASLIRDKLRAAGIPEEIAYLALVESGYDPHAYSSAAAVGMWQFMTRTARGYGLRVDWWIDERRDPVRATDAAIRYLNDLRAQFGSMYLAAAAYNGGAGRVSRGLARIDGGKDTADADEHFFTLASKGLLRAETKNYVPQLIAAALIGRDPSAYGITVDSQPAYAFDSVSVSGSTPLAAIASACGLELPAIADLNGQILRGMTPPTGDNVWVRVPPSCASTFWESFVALDSVARVGSNNHITKKGETLISVAKKAGMTSTTLRKYNPKIKGAAGAVLPAGTRVVVPTRETLRGARDVPDPAIERFGVAAGGVYTVRRGDTLGGIAQRHHTTIAALKRLNGLRSDKISAGQKLRVQ